MELVIDTHALHWFLIESKQLSQKAKDSITSANLVHIPSIVLLEAFFVAKKKNKLAVFKDFLKTLPNEKFDVLPLDLELVMACVKQDSRLEIHDLIILSSAKLLDLPIITKDDEITKVYKKTIW